MERAHESPTVTCIDNIRNPSALQSGAKERSTTENSDVLNRNFDLSVVDHIGQSLQ